MRTFKIETRWLCPPSPVYVLQHNIKTGKISGDARRGPRFIKVHTPPRERIFIELMTSDRKLKASREGSKGRIYGT